MSSSNSLTSNSRWYHIAVSFEGNAATLYIDGISSGDRATGNGLSSSIEAPFLIGASYNNSTKDYENHFSGWIEEVRIWNGTITPENIRFTMNQRLKDDGNIGEVVDMEHPDAPDFGDLAGYYRLISAEPDPIGLVTHAAELLPTNGLTIDLASTSVPGVLKNMETNQENTAPLPYISGVDGDWDKTDRTTWARPDVWNIPNTNGINWNIVKLRHNVDANRDITVLGLISEANTLDMIGINPSSWQSGAGGSGNELFISHYLFLDGVIDLNGESQLVQPELSVVASDSDGELHRDQQGTANSFNYNYWSSPVSSAPGNVPYTIKGVMKDGSNMDNGIPDLDFGDAHGYADGAFGNPRKVSRYWLNLFHGDENVYAQWQRITETTAIPVGEGYTMKGTANVPITDSQNYTFRGIPNNGDVNLSIDAEQSYMIGNPFPSSIDADLFIKDNLEDVADGKNDKNSFNGALYFWSHFAGGNTHVLKEYIGGYAVYNLGGGIKAFANDERINNTGAEGGEEPQRFIPVGQSFFVNSVSVSQYQNNVDEDDNPINIEGGPIYFKNSQRVFQPEDNTHSVFHKPEFVDKQSENTRDHTDTRQKIWLKFESPKGYHREILVAADDNASNGFDLGYDAPMIEYNAEDMFWLLGAGELVIQGVPDFNKKRVLPLGLVIDKKKNFTIKIEKLLNFEDKTPIYLKDKLNDSIHNLRTSEYVAISEPGYINERFELIFFKEIPEVPVIDFPGEVDENDGIYKEFGISIRHGQTERELQILNPHELSISDMYIFDLNGNKLEDHDNLPEGKEFRMPVKNYSSGVYIVQLVVEGRVVSKKIIISN